jgi:hypothetical protein
MECIDWAGELPDHGFLFQSVRAATGGVRKVTVLFSSGQLDLILVPAMKMWLARVAVAIGAHRKIAPFERALNELSTCLQGGYRFLKGEEAWGRFYNEVSTVMPGVRLSDEAARILADQFLCDFLWILQKAAGGELCAAQHLLHRSLADTNFRLSRELRLRRGLALPSFGLGRRVESILSPHELELVKVESDLSKKGLCAAAWKSYAGLCIMMGEICPAWKVPESMDEVLQSYAPTPAR